MPESTFKDLENKVAVITGASKGIGKAIATLLAEAGASVVVSSRKIEAVQEVADALTNQGFKAAATACHVGEPAALESLVEFAIDQFGGIDILVNNAATNPVFAPLEQYDTAIIDKIFDVNLKSCILLSNLCYNHMKARGGGSIINIASVEGLKPSTGLSLYSISKAGLIMLTKSQAKEWGQSGIRSNAICPGLIKTKLSKAIWQNEGALNAFTSALPLNRMGEPDEIARLALFLASDASSYCTGGIYNADGGYLV